MDADGPRDRMAGVLRRKGLAGRTGEEPGVNALPQLWIVDSQGTLRSVDAKQDAEALIEKAARGRD